MTTKRPKLVLSIEAHELAYAASKTISINIWSDGDIEFIDDCPECEDENSLYINISDLLNICSRAIPAINKREKEEENVNH